MRYRPRRACLGRDAIEPRGELGEQERACRIDQRPRPDRLPSKQHPVCEPLAVGEPELDHPGMRPDPQRRRDDVPAFALAGGTGHVACTDEIGLTAHRELRILRQGVDDETHARLERSADDLDILRMQRRRARTRVHFGFDGKNAQLRQRNPFAPSKDQGVELVRHAYTPESLEWPTIAQNRFALHQRKRPLVMIRNL